MSQRSTTATVSLSALQSGVRLCLRWMFVLIVALDLISSPWHAHRHEGAPESVASHADQIDSSVAAVDHHAEEGDSLTHVDRDKPLKIGHSITGLRGASVQVTAFDSVAEWVLLPSTSILLGLLASPEAEVSLAWSSERKRPRIPSFRALPPDGRAPPYLHA